MDSFKIKKGLGRGLSSLIGDTKVNTNTNKLLVSDLVRNKLQPRKTFDEKNLDELTNSIKERGVIQPIIVRKSEDQCHAGLLSCQAPAGGAIGRALRHAGRWAGGIGPDA